MTNNTKRIVITGSMRLRSPLCLVRVQIGDGSPRAGSALAVRSSFTWCSTISANAGVRLPGRTQDRQPRIRLIVFTGRRSSAGRFVDESWALQYRVQGVNQLFVAAFIGRAEPFWHRFPGTTTATLCGAQFHENARSGVDNTSRGGQTPLDAAGRSARPGRHRQQTAATRRRFAPRPSDDEH